MIFDENFKRLDNICKDIYDDSSGKGGVTLYINEMKREKIDKYKPESWKSDLDKLFHYRDIRNKYSHQVGFSEVDMVDESDATWLSQFHTRILNQTDPLSIYQRNEREERERLLKTKVRSNKKTAGGFQNPSAPFAEYEKNSSFARVAIAMLFTVGFVALFLLLF